MANIENELSQMRTAVYGEDMRKAIYDAMRKINDDIKDGIVKENQGAANAGKALVVGSDGVVTTGDAGIPDAVKVSLLDLVRHVAYIDDQGQSYYDALYAALYGGSGGYPRLEAVYAPGTHVVYTDDALDTLKSYLTVKRRENAQDSGTVVTDYTLSGTLVDGRNTVLVRADGLTTAVRVEAVDFYNQPYYSLSSGLLLVKRGAGTLDETTGDIWVNETIGIANYYKRRLYGVGRGKKEIVDYSTRQGVGMYPIPIPEHATKLTITANNQAYVLGLERYLLADGKYTRISGGIANTIVGEGLSSTFESASDTYCIIVARMQNDAQFSDTEPSEVTIRFE